MPINYTAPNIVPGSDHQTDAGGSTPLTAAFLQGIVDKLEETADAVDVLNGSGGGTSFYGSGVYGVGLYGQASGGGGGGAWGSITGTLSSQADLQTALSGKAAASHSHTAAEVTSGAFAAARLGSGTADSTKFLRGDGTWASPPGSGSGVEMFAHGTNAAAIRPVTSNIVIWVGTVQPTNWIDGDQWINATPA